MWVRIDDSFPDHPKLRSVGAFGTALQLAAICHCGRHLTDGFLAYSVADSLIMALSSKISLPSGDSSARAAGQDEFKEDFGRRETVWTPAFTCGMVGKDVDEMDWHGIMVDARLWDEADGGYFVHDYLGYNPSKDEVLALREARSGAGRLGGTRTQESKRLSKPEASAQANGKQTLKQNPSKCQSKSEARIRLRIRNSVLEKDSLLLLVQEQVEVFLGQVIHHWGLNGESLKTIRGDAEAALAGGVPAAQLEGVVQGVLAIKNLESPVAALQAAIRGRVAKLSEKT